MDSSATLTTTVLQQFPILMPRLQSSARTYVVAQTQTGSQTGGNFTGSAEVKGHVHI